MTYTSDLIIAILEHWEYCQAFIEKSTQELFQVYYEYPDAPEFWNAEGNTLQDRSPHNTRIPKKDNLKENLIVMMADIEMALDTLEPADQISVRYHFQLEPGKISNRKKAVGLAIEAVDKMVVKLNGQILAN